MFDVITFTFELRIVFLPGRHDSSVEYSTRYLYNESIISKKIIIILFNLKTKKDLFVNLEALVFSHGLHCTILTGSEDEV
jgi:hypothetical protein